jgi:hypothetical protein
MNTAAWILILFAHVGPLADGNSNALTAAEFTSKERCEAAGRAAQKLALNTVKKIEWTCAQK